jgi:hypothetical protein
MNIQQRQYVNGQWSTQLNEAFDGSSAQLVLAFGATALIKDARLSETLKGWYPSAHVVTVSTAGEILGTHVNDDSISLTAFTFDSSHIEARSSAVSANENSRVVGEGLAGALPHVGLRHVLVFSDGLIVNGSELVRGLKALLPHDVAVSGGLAGDKADFRETYVGLDGPGAQNQIVVVGLYGDNLHFGFGSVGGWDPFGIERIVTKSVGSVVYELDGRPILDLYKEYLGEQASGLPGTGLLFPLSFRTASSDVSLVRTLLAVDEAQKSITFAGDVPQGSVSQLMKANFDRIIEGAEQAATTSQSSLSAGSADFALLVSCVGRKSVLGQRTEEELEAAHHALGQSCAMGGFYAYGEIAPTGVQQGTCELHNQTMTVTTIKEMASAQ